MLPVIDTERLRLRDIQHHAAAETLLQWGIARREDDLVIGTCRLFRIETDIDPRNAGSIRSVERLGFKLEGHLRERFFVAGEIQDSLIYGLLAPDWRSR